MDDNKKKIDEIDKRAKELLKNKKDEINILSDNNNKDDGQEEQKGARAGSEFLANVFAGALLGYGIDWYFDTTPWAMIFFILIGFISGVYRANAAMKESYKENDK